LAAYYFTVAQFNGSNALLAVFDQYMIKNVTVQWIPLTTTNFIVAGTVATVAPTNVYNYNVLATCIDTDDANTPGSEGVVLDHESGILHGPFVKPFSRSLVPAVAVETYQTGGFGGYANRTNQWLDSAATATQHYGVKVSVAHGTTAPTATVSMAVYYHATVAYRKRF
jgi:hypothetical protein